MSQNQRHAIVPHENRGSSEALKRTFVCETRFIARPGSTVIANNSNLVVPFRSGEKQKKLCLVQVFFSPTLCLWHPRLMKYAPLSYFITETWLKDTVSDPHLCMPGYSFIYRNRTTEHHGGVGLHIENSIKFKCLGNLLNPGIDAL